MKKIFTLVLLLGFFTSLSAQRIQLLDITENGIYYAGATKATLSMKVHNNSSNTQFLIMERTENRLADQHKSQFCWGAICFDYATDVSQDPQVLMAGDTNSTFFLYVEPHGMPGTDTISFAVYPEGEPMDAETHTFIVQFTPTSVEDFLEDDAQTFGLASPYPNPASEEVNVAFKLPNGARDAHLVVRNTLGAEVVRKPLSPLAEKAMINLQGFAPGIYFISLYADGQKPSTKRFVVTQ